MLGHEELQALKNIKLSRLTDRELDKLADHYYAYAMTQQYLPNRLAYMQMVAVYQTQMLVVRQRG